MLRSSPRRNRRLHNHASQLYIRQFYRYDPPLTFSLRTPMLMRLEYVLSVIRQTASKLLPQQRLLELPKPFSHLLVLRPATRFRDLSVRHDILPSNTLRYDILARGSKEGTSASAADWVLNQGFDKLVADLAHYSVCVLLWGR